MFEDLEGRIDRLVEGLLRGKRLKARVADAAERDAIMAAAELAAAREGYPRMSPAFRRRLTSTLRDGRAPGLVTRRTALGAVAGLAAGAVGAAAMGRLPSGAQAPTVPPVAGGVMRSAGGRWIEVALLSQLSETEPTRVVAGDKVAFLFRQGDQVTGVSGLCTHWPCALNWHATTTQLDCPCHKVSFTPTGRSTNPNYEVPPLPQFQVRVEGGRVSVFSL